MEGRLLLKDCSLLLGEGRFLPRMCVVVDKERVVAVGHDSVHPTLPGDWEVSCRGRWVVPGFVDRESTWFASTRHAMGFHHPPLSPKEVEDLTLLGYSLALRRGYTCVAEPLDNVRDIQTSLFRQAMAAQKLGIRLVHSYRSTSSGDVLANAAHAHDMVGHTYVRVLLGLTPKLKKEALQVAQTQASALELGFHVDASSSMDEDLAEHAHRGSRTVWISREPTLDEFSVHQAHLGRWASEMYGDTLGHIQPGALADVLVLDWVPSTESRALEAWALLPRLPVAWTIVAGKVVVREGHLLTADVLSVAQQLVGGGVPSTP